MAASTPSPCEPLLGGLPDADSDAGETGLGGREVVSAHSLRDLCEINASQLMQQLQAILQQARLCWRAMRRAAAERPLCKHWRAALRLALGVFVFAMLTLWVHSSYGEPHTTAGRCIEPGLQVCPVTLPGACSKVCNTRTRT